MTAQKSSGHVRSVNSQITDAITQANVMNIGLAPAQSIGTLYQTTAQAAGTAMQNAVANQQNMYSLSLASTAQNLQSLLALSSASAARNTAGLLAGGGSHAGLHRRHAPAHIHAAHMAAAAPATPASPQTPIRK